MMLVLVSAMTWAFAASAAGSWVDVGERNVVTMRKLNEMSKAMLGKQISPALMARVSQDMRGFYADKLSCSAGDKGAIGSFSLTDVSFAECMGVMAKIASNIKPLDWRMENIAIDPYRGGDVILIEGRSDFVGMTSAGVEVPGAMFNKVAYTAQYTFNDRGLITRFHTEQDSGIIEMLLNRVSSFGVDGEQLSATRAWAAVGDRNVASVYHLNQISKQIQGKQITPALLAELSQDLMSFYAPKVSCSAGDKDSSVSFSLMQVPASECMQAFARMYANVKATHWEMKSVAIDPSSRGRTILTYQPLDCVGMSNAGVEVPGTELHAIDLSFLYKFNDMGQIVAFHQQVDSSMIEGLARRVASASLETEGLPVAASWKALGERNVARVLNLNRIEQEIQGKQINPALMAKLSKDVASFYAPEVSCSAGDKTSSSSFSLTQVPASQCMQAFAKMYTNVKATNWDMKSIAIDPASGGNTILTFQPLDCVGTTDDGVQVPGTEMHTIDLSFVYTFNAMGQIVRLHQQVDSGMLEAVARMVAKQQQSGEVLIGAEDTPTYATQLFVGAMFGAVACLSGITITRHVIARRDEPALLDHSF